ncbi:MAG: O-antigen ligase family protein [Candidatus Acidiferrales bacterium]
MSPSLATLAYVCGIASLFFLDRDNSVRTSKALWIPVIWLWIVGSRAVSVWLGLEAADATNVQLDSPVDRYCYLALLVVGLIVLIHRGGKTFSQLQANWPILFYCAFCLVSVTWSDFPDVALKRWIKASGDLVMVLIIITDGEPKRALERVLSRVGFILLPTSVLLIKYFPSLGRGFSPWDGTPWNTGVTTNKNSLGVIVLVLTLGIVWRVLTLLRSKGQPNRGRHLLAQVTILCFGVALLVLANSATSRACFALGALLMLATSLPALRSRPRAVHALILIMVLTAGLTMLFGGGASIAHALGRKADLTGRTEIWDALIPMVPNPVFGAGFESFWLGSRLLQVRAAFLGNPLNEAHNGYLEVYLNLGWIGVGLIAWILISGYRRAAAAFRLDPQFCSLLLADVAAGAVYNITEAGFRMLCPNWIFLLFAVVAASSVVLERKGVALEPVSTPTDSVVRSFVNRGAPSLRRTRV